MRAFLLTACRIGCVATFATTFATTLATAQVSITESPAGWQLTNGHIRIELTRASGSVRLQSLRREGGAEWAVAGTPLIVSPDKSRKPYLFADDVISDLDKGGKQLALRFKSDAGGLLSLLLKLYPTGAVIQTAMRLENRGQHGLLLNSHIDPLFLILKNPAGGLKLYSSVKGQHGFHSAASVSHKR